MIKKKKKMCRISNVLISVLNFATFLVSIGIIGSSLYLRVHGHSECQRFLQIPLLILGAFLLVLSILGFCGSCQDITSLLCIYLFMLFLLIVGLICLTIFAFVVTNKGAGQIVSGRGYKEYRLGDYSNWLQKYVVNGNNWNKIKSCLIDAQVCATLGLNDMPAEFYQKTLSSIQSGCCKPPTYCGFTYKNATFWEVPKSRPAVSDSDCLTWSNKQDTLCYDCKSCKAGVLDNLKREWKKLAIVNISVIIFLLIVNSFGSCAYRNSKASHYERYRGYYY